MAVVCALGACVVMNDHGWFGFVCINPTATAVVYTQELNLALSNLRLFKQDLSMYIKEQ